MPQPVIFISHASEDRDAARQLCALIEARGVPCWIAPRDVRPGYDWDEDIIDALDAASGLVLVLSRHSNDSIHVKHEVERASSKAKCIFTVRIEDIVPSKRIELHVSSRHWLDSWATPLDAAAHAIVRALEGTGERAFPRKGTSGERSASTRAPTDSFDLALVRLGASPFTFERERILVEGLHHVREGSVPIVLLQGLAGMGKTVLLRELVRRLRSDFPAFLAFSFDGPASREPSFFLEEVNELLVALGCGLPADALRRGEPARTLESLCARIAGQRILFVFDAVELADANLLGKFASGLVAAGGGSRCIMAGRLRVLGSFPLHVVTVGPLQEPEVRELIDEYVRSSRLDVQPAALESVLPPAIRTHPQALATILASLHDLPLELLLLQDLPEEARAPSALIEHVVRGVNGSEREVLAVLSLLSELDLAAAFAALALSPPAGFAPAVKSLLAKSLVVKSGATYSVPSVVRAALVAVDAPILAAQASSVADALAALPSGASRPRDALRVPAAVVAHVATRLAESHHWEQTVRMFSTALLDDLNRHGFWKEYCLLLRIGIEAAVATGDRPLQSALRLRLARKSLQTGDLGEGRSALAAAEAALGCQGDTLEHAELFSHMASFAEIDGDPQRALELLGRSRAILSSHGDKRGLALIEKLGGNIHLRLKDRAGARRCYEAVLSLLAEEPDSRDAIEALMGVALCDLHDERHEMAEARLTEALARCRATGYWTGVPRALITLASSLENQGRLEEALRVGREAVDAATGLGPALTSSAAMLVWRLETLSTRTAEEGGHGRRGGT
jgi:tetratricopeptide (TPR) repeat protein